MLWTKSRCGRLDPEQVIYRFIWMRSFHDQVSVMMHVLPEGNGQLRLQVYRRVPGKLDSTYTNTEQRAGWTGPIRSSKTLISGT